MIYHSKDGGAIRTQRRDSVILECQACGTTWSEKADLWQDCVAGDDVPNDVTFAADIDAVQQLPPVRDPKEARVGTVVEGKGPPMRGPSR